MSLDMLENIQNDWIDIEMVWLVNIETETILRASTFEISIDNEHWVSVSDS